MIANSALNVASERDCFWHVKVGYSPVSTVVSVVQRFCSLVLVGSPGLQTGRRGCLVTASGSIMYSIDPEVSMSSSTLGRGFSVSSTAWAERIPPSVAASAARHPVTRPMLLVRMVRLSFLLNRWVRR